MSHPARWKYLVVAVMTEAGKRYGVKARYAHGPDGEWLFLGELEDGPLPARRWIERQEHRGGYAYPRTGTVSHSARWKYIIVVGSDRRYGVKTRDEHQPTDPWLFRGMLGEGSEPAKLWIEQKEIEGGYSRPSQGGN